MKQLLIFPFSGTAVEALDCLGTEWNCIGFISDDPQHVGTTQMGIKVYDRSAFTMFPDAKVLAVPGSPLSFRKRQEIIMGLGISVERLAKVIHPKASVSSHAQVGNNSLIMAGAVITATAKIGHHVVILPNSVVHHDSVIGDYTLVGANVTIAGNVQVGGNCYIGAASSIRNSIQIGKCTLVGMGANVVQSYPENLVLAGNPAKPV